MKNYYDDNEIIIQNGFKYGVDFNISCREWNMLRFKQWINDNIMNRALALLLRRTRDYGKKYWIFNTYTMEYLMIFKQGENKIATTIYKNITEKIIFQYERFYCTCNI